MSFLLTFFKKELPPKELKSADKQLGKCIFKTWLGHFAYKGNSTFGKIILKEKIILHQKKSDTRLHSGRP